MLTEKDKRVEELLVANNAYLERARKAELALAQEVAKRRAPVLAALAATPKDKRADTLNDAIQHALSLGNIGGEGFDWLHAWNEGDPRAMRELEQAQIQKVVVDAVKKDFAKGGRIERRDGFTVPSGWSAEHDSQGRPNGFLIRKFDGRRVHHTNLRGCNV